MKKPRPLRDEECKLIKYLLSETIEYHDFNIEELKVVDMNDGGMGSVYFINGNISIDDRKMYKSLVTKQFEDIDGTPISISLNIDENNNLFELDIWRVDFNPVKKYPQPAR